MTPTARTIGRVSGRLRVGVAGTPDSRGAGELTREPAP
jgi:hypothetical protein